MVWRVGRLNTTKKQDVIRDVELCILEVEKVTKNGRNPLKLIDKTCSICYYNWVNSLQLNR